MKLGVIFGSGSTEHDVSIVSASSIIKNLDKNKYMIYPIYLDKNNNWYLWDVDISKVEVLKVGYVPEKLKPIDNAFKFLKDIDIVFPVLHGKFGEDGGIQGLLEVLGVPYVGCGILASSVSMDKIYTKEILKNEINVTDDIIVKYDDGKLYYYENCFLKKKISFDGLDKLIFNSFKYPVFIKPSRFGSSVGVSKANDKKELIVALNDAIKYDNEILIEKAINGRELECAVLCGKALSVGEVMSAENFYSYSAKYTNSASKTKIPADIPDEVRDEIKRLAEEAFVAINGKGLARVDFFLENGTNKLIINEINTMPGFTEISMYPKLAEDAGISYSDLLDKLIEDAKN